MDYPSISIIIPTLNSAHTLNDCLDSISIQDYPKEKMEIIVADGGSTDDTIDIVKNFSRSININLINNKLKTAEAGKAEGLRYAKNDIIGFIDSDNILPEKDWLRRMVRPFSDSDIVASEPLYYTYRKMDGFITRYCALVGMNDPFCLFLGNYDRYCALTDRWTEMQVLENEFNSYIKVGFLNEKLPTIGANGFFIRKKDLLNYPVREYFFDIDIIPFLYTLNSTIKVGKVKNSIVHIYAKTIIDFISKQIRRYKDYTYYKAQGLRFYGWQKISKVKVGKFILYTLSGITILQAIKGYLIKKDPAWFFHPLACAITLNVYAYCYIRNLILPLTPKQR
jgi:glycosyltransferase involved in cell wall biosynthesis